MALKAYQAQAAMSEIAEAISQADKRLAGVFQAIAVAKSTLDGMEATYGAFIIELDDAVFDNPGNPMWAELEARKDLFVTEFNALKGYVADLQAAALGVAKP